MYSEEKDFIQYHIQVVKEGIEEHCSTLRECAYSCLITDDPCCSCEKCTYSELYGSDEFQEAVEDTTWSTCERYIEIGVV